jgi:hypothetical protein
MKNFDSSYGMNLFTGQSAIQESFRFFPAAGTAWSATSEPSLLANDKRRGIYEKTSLNRIGDNRIGVDCGPAF